MCNQDQIKYRYNTNFREEGKKTICVNNNKQAVWRIIVEH